MGLQDLDETPGDLVVDAPDTGIMMRIEPGKTHQEIRFFRIEITLDNLFARRKILRVKIAQLLISGILDRLRVPFSAIAGVRAQDD